MNTELLRTFLEVAKTRHFAQAGENLFITQSAVSFRVKQLEEMLGTDLFTRERNNILLTPSGERLLPHAENMLAAWQAALQDVGVAGPKNVQLSIGSTSNLWDTFLQSLLPQMATRFPELYMRTEINPQRELVRAMLGGRLDLAVLLDPPQVSELNVQAIGHLELTLVASRAVADAEELEACGYVFVDWGTAFNLQQARVFDAPIAPVLHTGQSHIALEFLLKHGGAAFLPISLVEAHIDRGELVHVEHVPSVIRGVYLAHSDTAEQAKDVLPVVEFLKALAI
ncbi:LysR family transcriptional regulator [Paraferrimonas sedimenticola]|uniref:LysR family transcriptional regulator n=1 Tax=Paraferrimonas sedimenticola TaxID=375674 RepID=A0AA37RV54_9GAMM|nr:LysR family transcriptional regulator [Paraferrimonas sedimenticola]GLP96290.1 LysR family transcriptional regulator [Paraferrimonas sedimenticola]